MSRSNYDKPFYVDVGTSITAVRCASNHDVILRYDHIRKPQAIELAEEVCDRMNREAEIGRPRRNCDVGTAEEQIARFDAECLAIRKRNTVEPCAGCLCSSNGEGTEDCQLRWAQMPYEEGGAK